MFTNPDGDALNAVNLDVDADMSLRKAQCTGQVWLPGAHITGTLNCAEAVFNNPDGDALYADGLVVDTDRSYKAQCTGQVVLARAHIGGPLNGIEAVLKNPTETPCTQTGWPWTPMARRPHGAGVGPGHRPHAVATAQLNGRLVMVSGGRDTVRVWDLGCSRSLVSDLAPDLVITRVTECPWTTPAAG